MARSTKTGNWVGKASPKAIAAGRVATRYSSVGYVAEISVEERAYRVAMQKGRVIPPVEEVASERRRPGSLKGRIPELGKTLLDDAPPDEGAAWSGE